MALRLVGLAVALAQLVDLAVVPVQRVVLARQAEPARPVGLAVALVGLAVVLAAQERPAVLVGLAVVLERLVAVPVRLVVVPVRLVGLAVVPVRLAELVRLAAVLVRLVAVLVRPVAVLVRLVELVRPVVLVLPGKALLLVLRVALVLERLTGQPVPAQSRWAMTAMNAPRANATYCTGCLGIRHTMVGSLGGPLPA